MRTPPSPCPYLPGRDASFELLAAAAYSARAQEAMLGEGWRRAAAVLYRPACEGCRACIPIRLDLREAWMDGRRRAARARNRDIRALALPAAFSREHYDLFRRYSAWRHDAPPEEPSLRDYIDTYLRHPRDDADRGADASPLLTEYRDRNDHLVALGFLDVFPEGLSSVYFAFAPEAARRSPGVLSVALEGDLALSMGKRYYYLGFWVPGARTMAYKADFRPFELAVAPGTPPWTRFEGADDALADARIRALLPSPAN